MAEETNSSQKYEKTSDPDLCVATAKTPPSIPTSPVNGLRKSASIKRHNCLCSPTTHAGSFRCRYHRNSGLTRSSMSVGSKLSELTSKSTAMRDNMSHIHLITGHSHSSSSPSYLPA